MIDPIVWVNATDVGVERKRNNVIVLVERIISLCMVDLSHVYIRNVNRAYFGLDDIDRRIHVSVSSWSSGNGALGSLGTIPYIYKGINEQIKLSVVASRRLSVILLGLESSL